MFRSVFFDPELALACEFCVIFYYLRFCLFDQPFLPILLFGRVAALDFPRRMFRFVSFRFVLWFPSLLKPSKKKKKNSDREALFLDSIAHPIPLLMETDRSSFPDQCSTSLAVLLAFFCLKSHNF